MQALTLKRKQRPCKWFREGKCKFGGACRDSHEAEEVRMTGAGVVTKLPRGKGKVGHVTLRDHPPAAVTFVEQTVYKGARVGDVVTVRFTMRGAKVCPLAKGVFPVTKKK